MDPYVFSLRTIPLHRRMERERVEKLLAGEGLELASSLEGYYGVFKDDRLVAGLGHEGNVIKCAVSDPEFRGEGLLNALASKVIIELRSMGKENIFVFTKPANRTLFESICFHCVAETKDVSFLESDSRGLENWVKRLQDSLGTATGKTGAAVMNCNPFTLGHRYLIEQAAKQCDRLLVFVVEEDASAFPFAVRFDLVKKGIEGLDNVTALPGGPYMISKATFPTYFLKDASQAAASHAALDALLFAEKIAPAAGITARFVGEEPLCPLTAMYNHALQDTLPKRGIDVNVIPRKAHGDEAISASRVRHLLAASQLDEMRQLVPESTYSFLTNNAAAFTS